MFKKLSHEEIEARRIERNKLKRVMLDRLRMYLGIFAPFLLTFQVLALIWSAQVLEESKLAVVTGLISTISIGLLNILNGISVPQPEDPMAASQAKLIEMLKKVLERGSYEVRMDKNYVQIGQDGSKSVVTSNDKDLLYGEDDVFSGRGKKK